MTSRLIKGHFKSQAIFTYIIVKYINSISNDKNSVLKINDLNVTSNDHQGHW